MSIGVDLLMKLIEESNSIAFSRLERKWFEDFEKDLYDFMANHFNRYKKLPTIRTITTHFDFNYNISEPIQYYLDKFYERTVRNLVSEKTDKFNTLIDSENYDGLIDYMGEFINESKRIKTLLTIDVKEAKEIIEMSLEELIKRRIVETGIPTGWQTLDYATGGLQPGNIFLVLARVKMGKSMIMIHLANAAYNAGKKVLFISMEMSSKEVGLRLIGLRKGLNLMLLQRKPISTETEKLIRKELREMKEGFHYVEGQFKTNIDEIIGLIETYEPDVVYIDGGYLIKPKNKAWKNKWEMMGEVIESLKTFSLRWDIPIAISFQFNRDIKRTTKSVQDRAFEKIQLSDAISQVASTGIAILENEDIPDTRKIEIIGGRGGEQGEFIINWDWERMNFKEYD